jgi:putative ABC transport system substrate-binding protein
MRRREFIVGLGGTTAWPLAARAQQAMPVVGFLGSDSAELYANRLRALREGLQQAGYVEGRNVSIEYRWAEGRNDLLPTLATDLVRRQVAVIATSTAPGVLAAKSATTTIPIAFFTAGDPIALGLVKSMNRPGGNLTGTTTTTLEVGSKWLELLHELVPAATTFVLLVNPTSPILAEAQANDLRTAARSLGLSSGAIAAGRSGDQLRFIPVHAHRQARRSGASSSAAYDLRVSRISLGRRPDELRRNLDDQHRTLGVYIGRLLKGEKAAELPVQQSTKVELIINLKTARAIGITVPIPLLGRADEVIE